MAAPLSLIIHLNCLDPSTGDKTPWLELLSLGTWGTNHHIKG